MSQSITINSPVDVTAVGFGRDMCAYPRRIEFGGTSYSFIDAGLRAVVQREGKISQIFTMSDGTREYRLRSCGDTWTLLSMTQA